jgi:hypothetical protein
MMARILLAMLLVGALASGARAGDASLCDPSIPPLFSGDFVCVEEYEFGDSECGGSATRVNLPMDFSVNGMQYDCGSGGTNYYVGLYAPGWTFYWAGNSEQCEVHTTYPAEPHPCPAPPPPAPWGQILP